MISDIEMNFADDVPSNAGRDEIIKRLIVDEMYWDSHVDASRVLVEVSDGVATLTGHVATVNDRYYAEADARMVRGVVAVDNHLKVDTRQGVPDHELRENVEQAFNWSPDVVADNIEVAVHDGTVTLRGTVPTYWSKLRAHLIPGRVDGVFHVIDELVVTPSESIPDQEIARHLSRIIEHRLGDDANSVQLTVNQGVVKLYGSVPNAQLLSWIEHVTEPIVGVVAIQNELTIPHSTQGD